MSVTIRNYPRKPLSDKERTIRETLERLGNEAHPPYIFVSVADASLLQGVLNSFTNGGTVWLEDGTYNSGNLTVSNANVTLIGSGSGTVLTGSLLVAKGAFQCRDMWIKGTDQSYAVKLFQSGGDTARCRFSHVKIGGDTYTSSDGPTGPGLWIDGAIVSAFHNVTVAYCDQSGLYLNSSSGTYTTNVNSFYDCTFNGNGRGGTGYGAELVTGTAGVGDEPTPAIAGMMLNSFYGGNIENNVTGGVFADNNTGIRFIGVDFEDTNLAAPATTPTRGVNWNAIRIDACHNVVIDNCNFVSSGTDPAGRFFYLTGCSCPRVTNNRVEGYVPVAGQNGGNIGLFDERCVQSYAHNNVLWTSGPWYGISNRGSTRGHR